MARPRRDAMGPARSVTPKDRATCAISSPSAPKSTTMRRPIGPRSRSFATWRKSAVPRNVMAAPSTRISAFETGANGTWMRTSSLHSRRRAMSAAAPSARISHPSTICSTSAPAGSCPPSRDVKRGSRPSRRRSSVTSLDVIVPPSEGRRSPTFSRGHAPHRDDRARARRLYRAPARACAVRRRTTGMPAGRARRRARG